MNALFCCLHVLQFCVFFCILNFPFLFFLLRFLGSLTSSVKMFASFVRKSVENPIFQLLHSAVKCSEVNNKFCEFSFWTFYPSPTPCLKRNSKKILLYLMTCFAITIHYIQILMSLPKGVNCIFSSLFLLWSGCSWWRKRKWSASVLYDRNNVQDSQLPRYSTVRSI